MNLSMAARRNDARETTHPIRPENSPNPLAFGRVTANGSVTEATSQSLGKPGQDRPMLAVCTGSATGQSAMGRRALLQIKPRAVAQELRRAAVLSMEACGNGSLRTGTTTPQSSADGLERPNLDSRGPVGAPPRCVGASVPKNGRSERESRFESGPYSPIFRATLGSDPSADGDIDVDVKSGAVDESTAGELTTKPGEAAAKPAGQSATVQN
jgi:hypothetical protein